MKYLKGFKNPKKTKHWFKKDLDITWTDCEYEDFRKQVGSRSELIVEFLSRGLSGLSKEQTDQLSMNIVKYVQWSLLREKVIVGTILPDTLHPKDFNKK